MAKDRDRAPPSAGGTSPYRLHTISEATEFLQLSESTIRRAIRMKHLAAIKVGRAVRLAEADIDAWLIRNRRRAR